MRLSERVKPAAQGRIGWGTRQSNGKGNRPTLASLGWGTRRRARRAVLALRLAVVLQVGAVGQAKGTAAERLFSLSHPAMGTTYTLYIYAANDADAQREAERSFAVVDDVEALLSNYQPQSELSRINREAYPGPVTTDPETFRFLKESLEWSARSDGAFDITVGKLMKAWGFFRSTGHVPSDAELEKVRARDGMAEGEPRAQGSGEC